MTRDIASELRQTRANMIGTDDEDHYWTCQDAATLIDRLQAENSMLRERGVTEPLPKEKRAEVSDRMTTIHDAAPAATAESADDRTDKAAPSQRRDGTGDSQEPVAWIAVFDGDDADGEFVWPNEGLAREWARARPGVQIAPLYLHPQPTLTDAEREAILGAISAEHQRGAWQWAATLRKLLERLA